MKRKVFGCAAVFLLLFVASVAFAGTISFSGYDWVVRNNTTLQGPGPNMFSSQNVWVDAEGKLHLKIANDFGTWRCAEVYLTRSLGYGTYKFYVESPVDTFDKNTVVGLFNYEDDTREIDIEFAKWGVADYFDGQYVVQPGSTPGNIENFHMQTSGRPTTHLYTWSSERISFQSWYGATPVPESPSDIITMWTYDGIDNPPVGGELTHINFWLPDLDRDGIGDAPSDGKDTELIISAFEFIPLVQDIVAPDVFIVNPADGSVFTRKKVITLAATATDDVGVSKVEFWANGTLVCTDQSSPYECYWKTPNVRKMVGLQAKAYDLQGNIGTSEIVTVEIR